MDMRELRYFVGVARAGSFSRAAAELNIAQPALSRQIQKLERELRVRLLVRSGRGVQITAAGSTLLERAEILLGLMRQVPDAVRGSAPGASGHVTLGVPPAAGLLIAPAIIPRFRASLPQASLQLREGISSSLEEWLLDHRLDLAVLHNPPPLEAIEIVPMLQERMVVVAPRGGSFGGRDSPVRLRDLADLPLIMPSLPHSNRRLVEQAAIQHGARLRPAFEVDSVALTKALVKRGLGCTILTFAAVAAEIAAGELDFRPIHRPPLLSTVAIARSQEARPAWLAATLFRMLREGITELVESGAWAGARIIAARES